eukprot:c22460_g1_i2 orf=491-1696(+)
MGTEKMVSLESTWLGRTHFSRSICYRFDSCVASQLPLIPADKLFWEELVLHKPVNTELHGSDLVAVEGLGSRVRSKSASNLLPSSPAGHTTISTPFSLDDFPVTSRKKESGLRTCPLSFPRNGCSKAYAQLNDEHNDTVKNRSEADSEGSRSENVLTKSSGEYAVDLSELFLGYKFACGTYSRLYHGIYKDKAVAVKIMRQPDDNADVASRLDRQFKREVQILSCLHHPNIVEFVGACKNPPVCCIITEYLPKGSLRAFLHRHEPYSLSLSSVLDMALDIARGMEYLHSQGVIHRDLKSENLVLEDSLRVKITDFGVACYEADSPRMMQDSGTYRWMAPEMISNKPYSRKVDVYSFGIVLWELLTGQIPFEHLSSVQAAFAVVHKASCSAFVLPSVLDAEE